MAETKRILVVESDPEAAALIRRGLEPEETFALTLAGSLAEIGVDFVQGYGVGRPEPIGEMGSERALRALGS
jgi:EAL domain-containing protein (putative c-di-GMP-specific phosphodiesterase class I)